LSVVRPHCAGASVCRVPQLGHSAAVLSETNKQKGMKRCDLSNKIMSVCCSVTGQCL
jgi:hypothetical protein